MGVTKTPAWSDAQSGGVARAGRGGTGGPAAGTGRARGEARCRSTGPSRTGASRAGAARPAKAGGRACGDRVVWDPMLPPSPLVRPPRRGAGRGCSVIAVAYFHAWSMLHFAGARKRTKPTDKLRVVCEAGVLLVGIVLPRPTNRDLGRPGGVLHHAPLLHADHVDLEAWRAPHPDERGVVVLFHGYAATGPRCSTRRGPSGSRLLDAPGRSPRSRRLGG